MGFRFRKSMKIAPGVRLNFSTKGVGVSVGGKGLRISKSSRGTTVSAGIPGTGIYYQKQIASRTKRPQRMKYEHIIQQEKKRKMLAEAKAKVEQYEAYLDMLTSVHQEANDKINWHEIADSSPPFRLGEEDGPNVKELKRKMEEYKPTWRDRFFNRVEARKKQILDRMDQALEKDKSIYYAWKEQKDMAQKVLANHLESWHKVIEEANPFDDIEKLGSKVVYRFESPERAVVQLMINNRSVVPAKELSLTKTGKLSEKKMAKGKYFQLYQDYVCSCTLRIAREFFHLLPVKDVLVNVYDEAPADSEADFGCILSVRFPREKIESLNFFNIDCSDTIEQFEHRMKFLKTKGFKFVEEIQ